MQFVGPDLMHGFQHRVTTDIYPSDFAWTPDWKAADERIDKWYHNMQTLKESDVAQATFQIITMRLRLRRSIGCLIWLVIRHGAKMHLLRLWPVLTIHTILM